MWNDQAMRKRGSSRRDIELEMAVTAESELGFSVGGVALKGRACGARLRLLAKRWRANRGEDMTEGERRHI